MYFLSEASRGAKNQRPCKRKALRTHIPAQSFRRSSRELAHSARIVYLSGPICRSDLAPRRQKRLKRSNILIFDENKQKASWQRCQTPLIFDRIFESTKLLGTSYIREKY